MLLPINLQFDIILFSMLSGILTGILFDVYRVIRGYGVCFYIKIIEDILFWTLSSIIVFTFLLYTNYAFISFYVYLFIAIGIVIYLQIFSKWLFKIERNASKNFLKCLRILSKNISYVIRYIFVKEKNNK